MKHELIKQID
jgi:hypothetical protein